MKIQRRWWNWPLTIPMFVVLVCRTITVGGLIKAMWYIMLKYLD